MNRLLSRWAETARSVGDALLQVLAAEAGELQHDLARSGRVLRGGLVLLGVAAGLAFWTIGLGVWVAVELLALRLPTYGAALVVFAAGLVACAVLVWLGRRRLQRLESPLDLVQRHGREHVEWWQQTVLPGLGVETTPDTGAAAEDEEDQV